MVFAVIYKICILFILMSGTGAYQALYVRYFKCNLSLEFYFPNYTCFAKSINRTCSTVTAIFESRLPLDFVNVEATIMYKYGTIYRQVIEIKRFEYCDFVKAGSRNPVTNFIINLIDESAPGFVHRCPYKLVNVTQSPVRISTVGSLFATGDYKTNFILTNADGKRMFSSLFVTYVNSSDKNSFG